MKLGRHQATKTNVVIKIMAKSQLDAMNLEKIYGEVQIIKMLYHPHIILSSNGDQKYVVPCDRICQKLRNF